MADLSKEMIKSMARLCRIECTEESTESLFQDLSQIVGYMEQLQEVDTEGVEPCCMVLSEIKNVTRNDQIGETIPREDFLNNAPDQIGGMIRVPSVIKKGQSTGEEA